MTVIIGHILAIGIGLSLGLIGGGGSVLAVPILVYVMGVNSKAAIAMSLVIVGTVSMIGAIPHWKQGNVNFKTAIVFTPAAMVGAYLGARITALPLISDTFQLICFGIIMAIASILMIRKGGKKQDFKNSELGKVAIAIPSFFAKGTLAFSDEGNSRRPLCCVQKPGIITVLSSSK